jgi:uncharacterized membrane protein YidH (DUF202 family)
MFAYDVAHPDRFLHADRAYQRLQTILGLPAAARSGQAGSYIAAHGIPGDWLPQGLLYLVGGQYLVITVQVLLALLSIVWVRDLGSRVGLPRNRASAAALLYALLPHTLVFPHQLASEAIFVPLVILAFRAASANAGLTIGLATLVRPLTLLWPFAQALSLPSRKARRELLVLAFVPLGLWMGFEYLQSGELSMGRSDHDLGSNLYQRMQRIAASLPQGAPPATGETRASLAEYARFVAAYPGPAARHAARDLAALAAKSGIERLTLDYLDLFPTARTRIQDSGSGWRVRAEQIGVALELADLFRQQPGLVATSLGGALLCLAFTLGAGLGALRWLHTRRTVPRQMSVDRLLLCSFVVYVFATALCVDAAQSRHRAPAEFALCLLAVAGLAQRRYRFLETLHDR